MRNKNLNIRYRKKKMCALTQKRCSIIAIKIRRNAFDYLFQNGALETFSWDVRKLML